MSTSSANIKKSPGAQHSHRHLSPNVNSSGNSTKSSRMRHCVSPRRQSAELVLRTHLLQNGRAITTRALLPTSGQARPVVRLQGRMWLPGHMATLGVAPHGSLSLGLPGGWCYACIAIEGIETSNTPYPLAADYSASSLARGRASSGLLKGKKCIPRVTDRSVHGFRRAEHIPLPSGVREQRLVLLLVAAVGTAVAANDKAKVIHALVANHDVAPGARVVKGRCLDSLCTTLHALTCSGDAWRPEGTTIHRPSVRRGCGQVLPALTRLRRRRRRQQAAKCC